MYQRVGAGGGCMWQRVGAGVGVCGRGWGVGACGRCVGMWKGWTYVVGGQAYGMDRDMWQEWGHVVGCGCMWQGVGPYGKGRGRDMW